MSELRYISRYIGSYEKKGRIGTCIGGIIKTVLQVNYMELRRPGNLSKISIICSARHVQGARSLSWVRYVYTRVSPVSTSTDVSILAQELATRVNNTKKIVDRNMYGQVGESLAGSSTSGNQVCGSRRSWAIRHRDTPREMGQAPGNLLVRKRVTRCTRVHLSVSEIMVVKDVAIFENTGIVGALIDRGIENGDIPTIEEVPMKPIAWER